MGSESVIEAKEDIEERGGPEPEPGEDLAKRPENNYR